MLPPSPAMRRPSTWTIRTSMLRQPSGPGLGAAELVPVQRFVDLVGDGEDSRDATRGTLDALEAKRGPLVVEGDEGDRLVARLRGDLAEHVALPPRRRGRKIGHTLRLASLGVGDPEQPVRLDGMDGG